MREYLNTLLKAEIHAQLVKTRMNLGLTLSEMAERLMMDVRSMIDLDHGKYSCSLLSFVLYLHCVCEHPAQLLFRISSLIDSLEHPVVRVSPEMRKVEQILGHAAAIPVSETRVFHNDNAYPVCPKCGVTLEREYQNFCDRCGQALAWGTESEWIVVSR